jgi:hypothetical protein
MIRKNEGFTFGVVAIVHDVDDVVLVSGAHCHDGELEVVYVSVAFLVLFVLDALLEIPGDILQVLPRFQI